MFLQYEEKTSALRRDGSRVANGKLQIVHTHGAADSSAN
jgi:hypothetical protein